MKKTSTISVWTSTRIPSPPIAIEELKQFYRKRDVNPDIARAVAAEINKRAMQN